MSPAEEDALVRKTQIEIIKHSIVEDGERLQELAKNEIRLAIRAAVAAERERCAGVCESKAWTHRNTPLLGPELNSMECAAAIRRGE